MTRLILSAASTVAVLLAAGCDRTSPAVHEAPKAMTGPELAQERDRCRDLGLKANDDAACKAALQERRDRFLGKDEDPRR
jgi:conjugative transfer region protein TrbK